MGIFSKAVDTIKLKIATHILQPLLNIRRVPKIWKHIGTIKICVTDESESDLIIKCHEGYITVSSFTPQIMRVLIKRNIDPEYISWCVDKTKAGKVVTTSLSRDTILIKNAYVREKELGLTAILNLDNSTFKFIYNDNILHTDYKAVGFNRQWVACSKIAPQKEYYVGFGEKSGHLFKNGQKLIMWNTDNSYMTTKSDPLWQSCPLQICLREDGSAHGIFYDNAHYSVFKVGLGNKPVTYYAAERGPLCYYVLAGPTLKKVLEQFIYLTGKYPLPPRWVLGHHHSRWDEEESAEKILSLADQFRKKNVPCDVLHLDIGHMEGYRCFTWNKKRFPDPQKFIKELHKKNFKAVIIVDPGIKKDTNWQIYKQGREKGYFCRKKNNRVYHAPVWPGNAAFVDFTNTAASKWWGELYRKYTDCGVDGFWNDMNEPSLFTPRRTMPNSVKHGPRDKKDGLRHISVHNVYGMLMAKATYRGVCKLKPERRNFIFSRSAFAGIQRYASTWSGDNTSCWQHLRLSLPMHMNMGLSGQVIVGPDIGGFWRSPSVELMIRWMQTGAFYPFCRNHTSRGTKPQEVWAMGEEVERISRKYLELRYSLLPYLYTQLSVSCRKGYPLMRPLFFDFNKDKNCFDPQNVNTEFMVGPDILVAPVMMEKARKREVYLPAQAQWLDWWLKKIYQGGNYIKVDAGLDVLPLFVRCGAVIASCNPVFFSEKNESQTLDILIFPDQQIEGDIYLDDGKSLDYRDGKYSLIKVIGDTSHGVINLTIARTQGELAPIFWKHPDVILKIYLGYLAQNKIKSVQVNHKNSSKKNWQIRGKWLELKAGFKKLPKNIIINFQ